MFGASAGGGVAASTRYRHPLVSSMSLLLAAVLGARPGRRRGWSERSLALTALLMSLDDGPTLLDRFLAARALLGGRCGRTYQGLAKAMERCGAPLVERIRLHLTGLLRARHAGLMRIGGWLAFAIDGSRFDVPRTIANQETLGTRSRRGGVLPQIGATVLVHLGSGLLWDWRLSSGYAGERRGMLDMLGSVPEGSLLVADAGFVGYDCLRAAIASGRHVLVRLAGNITVIRGLSGRKDLVALWPQKCNRREHPPLWLRVITVRDGRNAPVYLGTSVLEHERLSDEQAAAFYRLRWGVEVCYRSLKQTLRRRKLLSASPRRAMLELHWTLLGLMMLGMLTIDRLPPGSDRRRWSVALAARAVRHAARVGRVDAARHLRRLRSALCGDNRRRRKASWRWPHKKHPPPLTPPEFRQPTSTEKRLLAVHFPYTHGG
jgi:hypothetical protein